MNSANQVFFRGHLWAIPPTVNPCSRYWVLHGSAVRYVNMYI